MHWAASYLREDLQDIRNESRDTRKRIDEVSAEAASERREIQKQITTTNSRIDSYFRWTMMAMIAITGATAGLIKL